MPISRRQFLADAALAGVAVAVFPRLARGLAKPSIVVYKSPSCGCCGKWVEHMRANGFDVTVKDMDDITPIKTKYKVSNDLASCHTAIVEGYVVEGHVPADDVKRLLNEKPKVVGLTIPGMPQSAPGMDVLPYQSFTVLSFDATGTTAVFAKH